MADTAEVKTKSVKKKVLVVDAESAVAAVLRAEGHDVQEVKPAESPAPVLAAAPVAEATPGVAELQAEMVFPQFAVKNRTRAQTIVRELYGPRARIRISKYDGGEAQVVLQDGPGPSKVLRRAPTLTALLQEPVESYVRGGKDLQETKRRIASLQFTVQVPMNIPGLPPGAKGTEPSVALGAMAYKALLQFPEFRDPEERRLGRVWAKRLQDQALEAEAAAALTSLKAAV